MADVCGDQRTFGDKGGPETTYVCCRDPGHPDDFHEWPGEAHSGAMATSESMGGKHIRWFVDDVRPPEVWYTTLGDPQVPYQPSDAVNHPPHYTSHPSGIECIAVVEHMPFNLGNAVKYIWRAGEKGDAIEDLRKAAWYVNREIGRLSKS